MHVLQICKYNIVGGIILYPYTIDIVCEKNSLKVHRGNRVLFVPYRGSMSRVLQKVAARALLLPISSTKCFLL